MRRFEIGGVVLDEADPDLTAAVAAAHRDRVRPLCLCRQPGVAMYVARIGDQHVIKRMPLTGGLHDPECDSYEPPLELSGLGPLMGNAIRLDPETGQAALRLEFSLSRTGSRAPPTPGASEASSVKSEARRAAALSAILPQKTGPRRLMVLVGEIKEFQAARGGHRVLVKHMPGFPLLLNDKGWQRLKARFEIELALWSANDAAHLVAIATFGVNEAGLAAIEEIALMMVTENWIPYESVHEERLVGALAKLREQSIKGLRYGLPSDQPMVAALLMQRQPKPLALYIVPGSADDAYEAELSEMIAARPDFESWIWHVAQGDMPLLPAR